MTTCLRDECQHLSSVITFALALVRLTNAIGCSRLLPQSCEHTFNKCSFEIRWPAWQQRASMSSLICYTANAPMPRHCLRVCCFGREPCYMKTLNRTLVAQYAGYHLTTASILAGHAAPLTASRPRVLTAKFEGNFVDRRTDPYFWLRDNSRRVCCYRVVHRQTIGCLKCLQWVAGLAT